MYLNYDAVIPPTSFNIFIEKRNYFVNNIFFISYLRILLLFRSTDIKNRHIDCK